MIESHTAVLDRDVTWTGEITTEPYEAGWATEALFFVRVLDSGGADAATVPVHVEISPDGLHWTRHDAVLSLGTAPGVYAAPVTHFGNWLRLSAAVPADVHPRVIVYLALKG